MTHSNSKRQITFLKTWQEIEEKYGKSAFKIGLSLKLLVQYCLFVPKANTIFNNKTRIHFSWYDLVQDIRNYLREHCYQFLKFFSEFVCFQRFKGTKRDPHKGYKFDQNHQKSTKIDFFSNSCDRSLEYLLKYLGYDFQGHTTHFDKIMIF